MAKYTIAENEEGLHKLITDLLALPDSSFNRKILVNILKSRYSLYPGYHGNPAFALCGALLEGKGEYKDIRVNALEGAYTHSYAPKAKEDFQFDEEAFIEEGARIEKIHNLWREDENIPRLSNGEMNYTHYIQWLPAEMKEVLEDTLALPRQSQTKRIPVAAIIQQSGGSPVYSSAVASSSDSPITETKANAVPTNKR